RADQAGDDLLPLRRRVPRRPRPSPPQGLRSSCRRAVCRDEDRAADAMKIYDVSRRITEETPVWPGDIAFSWRELESPGAMAPWRTTCFSMSAHCGTHAAAPSHVFADGKTIAEAPLSAFIGPARVIDLGVVGEIGADALPRMALGISRVLFRSGGKAS